MAGLVWLLVGVVPLTGCAGPLESAGRQGPGAEVAGEVAFASPWQAESPLRGHDLMVTGADGEQRYLTRSRATDIWPAWSPDGQQLAFASDRDGPGDIFVLGGDGQLDNLTASDVRDAQPAWSPDGQHIAFVRSQAEEDLWESAWASDVWVMRADGSEPRNLTETSGVINTHPSWSPDGDRLAFMSTREGRVHLWVLEVDSGQLHNLSEVSGPDAHAMDAFPAWSPDGERIAFLSTREGVADVWLMEPNGQGAQRLTDETTYEAGPLAWSPDGRRLAVASTRADDRIQGVQETFDRMQQATAAEESTSRWSIYLTTMHRAGLLDGLSVLPVDGDGASQWLIDTPRMQPVGPAWRAAQDPEIPQAAAEVGERARVGAREPLESSADITIDGELIGPRGGAFTCEEVMLDLPDVDERDQRHLRIESDDDGQTVSIQLALPFREGEHSDIEDDEIRRIAEDVETVEIESRRIRGSATLEPRWPEYTNAEPVEITFDIKCGYRGE